MQPRHAAQLGERGAIGRDLASAFSSSFCTCLVQRLCGVHHCMAHGRLSWIMMAARLAVKACVQCMSYNSDTVGLAASIAGHREQKVFATIHARCTVAGRREG